jgi:hypothetical protein
MYQPTPENSFPNLQIIGPSVAAIMEGPTPHVAESSAIYDSETHTPGEGGTWDPNGSTVFNANLEPFVGFTHQRAVLKSRKFWGAASYSFDTDRSRTFDFTNARMLKLSAASRSGPRQLIIQLYGENQESAKVAVDLTSMYGIYEFEIANFKEPGNVFDFSKVKGLVFAISEENSDVTIDIDSIQVQN